ncbi:L-amino acid N-acyltransferase YncA [Allocatelliglobosispora scoriae]|uniref:L-amino acid N-acyltransferase YncA n=1 Tax=Allocatelliglobosispora scoriae TaxID=643052 RepID=A0A841BI97_9ACTN|nr:GNAT family N-acetyltransferase [Allocatelliglobosispora scoriae]MBB5867994.1 L-amino acid N-acyltransferase YncA [Allocatelliglobosispora scoriae]
MSPRLRPALATDYDTIAAVVDAWWGRPILPALPRLFLDHFHRTSLVAEAPDGGLAGFLVGIISPSEPTEAYIHFVGVSPAMRGTGLARALYAEFFALARAENRTVVRAVTAPVNAGSISFHLRMGFAVTGPVPAYNGPGHDLVVFERSL